MTLSKLFLIFLIFQLTFIEITARGRGGGGGHSSGGSSGGSHASTPSTTSTSTPTTTTSTPSTTSTKPTTTSTKPTTTGDTSAETPTTSTTKPTTTDDGSSDTPTTSTTKPTTTASSDGATTSGGKPSTVTIAGKKYVAVDSAEYTSSDIQSSLNTGIGAVNQNLEGVLPSRLGTPKINKVQRQEDVPTNYVYDVSLTGLRGFILRTTFLVDATTSDVNVLSYHYEYLTNVLEDILTESNEENQEAEWSVEYETYEFDENGEFVGDGLTPISLDTAESDQAIQNALDFGNTFVINKATKTGELGSNDTEFKQLLAVSSKTVSGGVEYEFHVEIGDPDVDEESEWMHVFFAVNVEDDSGTKEVTSYSVLTLFDTDK